MIDPITKILKILTYYFEKYEIKYVIVGGISVLVFGRIRMTTDVDIIFDHKKIDREDFIHYLQKEGFDANLSDLDPLDELLHGSIFLKEEMFRVDLKGIFSEKERKSIELAVKVEFNGIEANFDDPNSIIVNKLSFGSEQDYEDALAVYVKSYELIDSEKLHSLANDMGINDKLTAFMEEVKKYLEKIK